MPSKFRDTDTPLVMCKNQLEHQGGAFWCTLPIGHAGPHEPAPHELGNIMKRVRGPPKRLSDEAPEPLVKKPRRRNSDGRRAGPINHHSGSAPRAPRRRRPSGKRKERRSLHMMQARSNVQPSGYITAVQQESRKAFAKEQLAELQRKLSEEMRDGGWFVLPKSTNAVSMGHLWVCEAFAGDSPGLPKPVPTPTNAHAGAVSFLCVRVSLRRAFARSEQ